ncbi:MAG: efflux RND transporter periplasmic adaptor subunit [Clostridium sp.]|uniref:efflux RND transporter periplasmic adaptor subunit n=1 Tax=Clostridium sp. TaxID=1506 RepID=UPI0039EA1FDA
MKSKLIKAIIACVVVAMLGTGGYFGYKNYFGKKTTTTSTRYYSASVTKMNLSKTVQGTGAVYSGSTKDVTPNNNGTLSGLTVKTGDTVKAGQTLFTASSSDLTKAVTTAQNNLTKAQLSLSTDESADKVDANKVAQDKISVSDAEDQLTTAQTALNSITVTAPIGGLVTAVNNVNGDTVQAGKSVLTIQNMSSLNINVSVDELDINKIALNQKATIKFDAISDKTYNGTVASIAQTGTTSNSVTTYNVVVTISNPDSNIKLGMNGTATIAVQSKENALVIPAEALVETNGQKYVRVADTSDSSSSSNNSGSSNSAATNGNRSSFSNSGGKLVAIKTGLETENYIEVTEGVKEGDKILVQLPQSTTTNSNRNNGFGGMGQGMNGGMGGGPQGSGGSSQGRSSSGSSGKN